MVLTAKLAEVLRVQAGDTLEVQLLTGDRRTGLIPVTGVVNEPVGFGATMADDALARWLGERPLADMALVEMDEAQVSRFLARTKEVPKVTSAIQQKTLIALFQEMMNRTMWVDLVFLAGFAGALAFSIVYNDARITLSERARELATLHVIGFSHREVARLLFSGLAVEVLAGPSPRRVARSADRRRAGADLQQRGGPLRHPHHRPDHRRVLAVHRGRGGAQHPGGDLAHRQARPDRGPEDAGVTS